MKLPSSKKRDKHYKQQYLAAMTPEEKSAFNEKNRVYQSQRKARMNPHQKALQKQKEKSWNTQRWNRATPEEKQHRITKNRLWRKQNLDPLAEKGICSKSLACGKPTVGKSKHCLWHWIKSYCGRGKDYRNRGSINPEALLKIWEEQHGRCAITDIELVPAETAELDHILPVNRGGTYSSENLRFVHKLFNKMKMDKTDEELKTLLRNLLPALENWCQISL